MTNGTVVTDVTVETGGTVVDSSDYIETVVTDVTIVTNGTVVTDVIVENGGTVVDSSDY